MKKETIDFSKLSETELRKLSLEKDKNGCATKDALKAQTILWNRVADLYPDRDTEVNYDTNTSQKILSLQYDGKSDDYYD